MTYISLNQYELLIFALVFSVAIIFLVLYARSRKAVERLEKQLHYSKVRVVRDYWNGRIMREQVYPIEDGTLPLPYRDDFHPILSTDVHPGTRMPEMEERK